MIKPILEQLIGKIEGSLAQLYSLEDINLNVPVHGNTVTGSGIRKLVKNASREVISDLYIALRKELEGTK